MKIKVVNRNTWIKKLRRENIDGQIRFANPLLILLINFILVFTTFFNILLIYFLSYKLFTIGLVLLDDMI
ncbi:hypothetical protein HanHA300_Chr11g0395941 [Helianthus annuus]|nr:hypothetical protein HanHA300_Chr11g0395941 [Helianthus annuus]KAJ0684917.1 hypothetical protein HanLR1_Chr11g0396611 [Helianthus annuus]KAJ0688842.1 hypothetical protein HanOQP8_Chr11g0398811 [Helianthus annuus]